MQYQRKRKIIQQRIIKSNNINFRTNYTNVSKTNESTKEESKFIQPWKIPSIHKYENNTKYIIQNEHVNEKEQYINVSQKKINNDNSQENKISMVEVNWENKSKNKILNKVYTNPYTAYNNYSNLYNQNYNNNYYNNNYNIHKDNYGISYTNDYNNNANVNNNGYNYSLNERDTSYPRFEKDNSNSNIISLRIRKTQKSSSNISNLRNSDTSDYNTYYQNSIFKESIKQKDENKSNSFESLTSQNTNNYKSNSIRNNNSKVNSIRNTYNQNIVLKKNITTNYSNYYNSSNITPKKIQ
jgi:hypothetical protein